MRRHAPLAPSSLTSLVDILFVLVFAALVQRAAVGKLDEAPAADAEVAVTKAPAWRPPPQVEELRQAAIATVASELQGRPAIIARVSRLGVLTALEATTGPALPVELPLIEPVSDPDIALGYVGERDGSRRVCSVVAARLGELRAAAATAALPGATGGAPPEARPSAGPPSLARMLVVISVDAPMAELTVALASGLRRDVEHCLAAHQAAAVLLDAAAMSTIAPPPAPRSGDAGDGGDAGPQERDGSIR